MSPPRNDRTGQDHVSGACCGIVGGSVATSAPETEDDLSTTITSPERTTDLDGVDDDHIVRGLE